MYRKNMKRYIVLIFIIFLASFLYAQDKNDFNTYLLLNKNFFSIKSSTDSSNFDFQENFINRLKEIDVKSDYTLKFKTKKSDFSIKLNKINDENVDLKIHEKDFIDFKSFSFNYKQLWKYNISTSLAYFFKKYSNFQFLDTDFEKKGYSFNITKYIKSNKFSLSYEKIDLSSDKTYEDIYIENEEKDKLTLSYQLNLNKNFSVIFLYSLTKYNNNEDEDEDLFFTGLKYKFDFFKNLE